MKLYKFVSFASLAIVSIVVLLLVSAPFKFPGSTILWKPAILFLIPALAIVGLLFIKPLLSQKTLLIFILSLIAVAILGTIVGWMSPIMLGVFLVACFALYFSSGIPRLNFRH